MFYLTSAGAGPILFSPTVTGDDFYVWAVNDSQSANNDNPSFNDAPVELSISANDTDLDPDEVVEGAWFCAGEKITFDVTGRPWCLGNSYAKWTLPGTFVNRRPYPTVCDLYYDENTDLLTQIWSAAGSFSTFCWYVNGFQGYQGLDADVDLHLFFANGQTIETGLFGKFNVFKPKVVNSYQYPDGNPPTAIILNNNTLSLGQNNGPNDMSFRHEINSGDFAGDVGYVQVITTGDIVTEPPVSIANALDAAFGEFPSNRRTTISPSLNTWANKFFDAPSVSLPAGLNPVTMDETFSTYLMFNPNTSGSIWVPLRLTTWELHDGAEYRSGWIPFNSNNGKSTTITGDKDSTDFPNWTKHYP